MVSTSSSPRNTRSFWVSYWRVGGLNSRSPISLRCAGHKEWLASLKNYTSVAGFSLLVNDGRVTGFFPLSSLNPTDDAKLPVAMISETLKRLPTGPALKLYD